MTLDENQRSLALISARGISKSYNHSGSGSLIEILKWVEIDISKGDCVPINITAEILLEQWKAGELEIG